MALQYRVIVPQPASQSAQTQVIGVTSLKGIKLEWKYEVKYAKKIHISISKNVQPPCEVVKGVWAPPAPHSGSRWVTRLCSSVFTLFLCKMAAYCESNHWSERRTAPLTARQHARQGWLCHTNFIGHFVWFFFWKMFNYLSSFQIR